jgi:nitrogen fixation protein FixH
MKNKVNYWVGGLICLGLFFSLITGWSIFSASRGVSSIVDPNYYAHGLKYNDTQLERRAVLAMGWHAAVTIAGRRVVILLSDGENPVPGCQGHILLHVARADTRLPLQLDLVESSPGTYGVLLPANISGGVPAELSLGRDGMILHRNVLLNITGRN